MSIEEEYTEPSVRTREHVEMALKAFDISISSVKIYGLKNSGDIITIGESNSIKKTIAINEDVSELQSMSTSFHEAAHIKDDANNKIEKYAKCLTYAIVIPYVSMFNGVVRQTERMFSSRFVQTMIFASYGIFGIPLIFWFHKKAAIPWAIEQAEYRANKLAIKKLLSLDKFDEILVTLLNKQILKREYGYARLGGHPPAGLEYKAMKKTLQEHGYDVIKTHTDDAPNILEISIIKNGDILQKLIYKPKN